MNVEQEELLDIQLAKYCHPKPHVVEAICQEAIEEMKQDEIFRYTIALEVFEQYKFYGYDKELPYKEWLERAIKISEKEKSYNLPTK